MKKLKLFYPLINDLETEYVKHRKMGRGRFEAIELLRNKYAEELEDTDERSIVLIGLSLALCKKKELFEAIAEETMKEIQCAKNLGILEENICEGLEQYLQDKTLYGEEAIYKRTAKYVPAWEVGDVFSHVLTFPDAEKLGINGWVILFYKAGELEDEFGETRQLMYVTLCPPDKVPASDKDFEELSFLPMMGIGQHLEYLAQILIKSKKAEEGYGLSKIGHFPDVPFPGNPNKEHPLTAMPLFGRMKRYGLIPVYEDLICSLYRDFGKTLKQANQKEI